jgi:hypothetical protein
MTGAVVNSSVRSLPSRYVSGKCKGGLPRRLAWILALLPVLPLYAQNAGTLSGGAGLEISTISFNRAAGSLLLYGAYSLSPRFALGLKLAGGSDVKQMASLEGAAFFRWYFFTQGTLAPAPGNRNSGDGAPPEFPGQTPKASSPASGPVSGPLPRRAFFVQAAAGGGVYSAFIDPNAQASIHPQALGEAAAGLRLYFRHNGSPVFLEPFVRYAYPSGFGAGFVFGGG